MTISWHVFWKQILPKQYMYTHITSYTNLQNKQVKNTCITVPLHMSQKQPQP